MSLWSRIFGKKDFHWTACRRAYIPAGKVSAVLVAAAHAEFTHPCVPCLPGKAARALGELS